MKQRLAYAVAALLAAGAMQAAAQALPAGFQRSDPFTGRSQPTAIAFAHDGRVFVAEKGGRIWAYANLLDAAPVLAADLGARVHDFWDRGLLGFTLDPHFPEAPFGYVLYTYNGGLDLGGPTPRWPAISCPTPPGATTNGGGCVVSGRLSRITLDGTTGETVLLEDWYQQFPSHSIGTVAFGADGYLYAGGGDGASFNGADFGQWGNPAYPDLSYQWRLIEETRPTFFGLSPAFTMACRKEGLEPGRLLDLSSVRMVCEAGSPLPLEGWVGAYAHESGADSFVLLHRTSLGEILANAVSAAIRARDAMPPKAPDFGDQPLAMAPALMS